MKEAPSAYSLAPLTGALICALVFLLVMVWPSHFNFPAVLAGVSGAGAIVLGWASR